MMSISAKLAPYTKHAKYVLLILLALTFFAMNTYLITALTTVKSSLQVRLRAKQLPT